ncbi:MAG TPA: hypothetical protein VJ183_10245 [Chloroflexia bacterium]|nr:hypothetical protein [Chloroflexia bacterium]
MLDDALLQSFTNTFYGYGNYQGRYWFIGMEEGGGGSTEEVSRRLSAWDDRGRKEVEGPGESHSEFGVSPFFKKQPKSQPTWNKLIRILLSIEGKNPTLQEVKSYQATNLGKSDSDTCLLELLPLPSPHTGKWLYADSSLLPQLRTRDLYRGHYAPLRAMHIKERIEEHTPAVVVFYSFNGWYRQWWELIAGVTFTRESIGADRAYLGSNDHTVFAIVKHPVARRTGNDYFHQAGRLISTRLGSQITS